MNHENEIGTVPVHFSRLGTPALCGLMLALAVATSLPALGPPPSDPGEKPQGDGIFVPPDFSLMRMLTTSRELLDEGRYAEAVRLLASILQADEDYFMAADPADGSPAGRRYLGLKNEAWNIVRDMPAEARSAYELQFGQTARRLLDTALAAGDMDQALAVQRQYFHTFAGYDAAVLLGNYYLDRGRPLAAAFCFRRIQAAGAADRYEPGLSLKLAVCWRQAGYPAQAAQVLVALQQRFPEARFTVGGRTVELFRRPDEALDWLQGVAGGVRDLTDAQNDDWPMFRGDPARLGRSEGGRPLLAKPIWRQPVSASIEAEMTLKAQRTEYFKQSAVAVPSVTPLAVGEMIVTRTPQRLAAVDFQTGKLLWEVDQPSQPMAAATPPQAASRLDSRTLKERLWLDKTYGSLSSDGQAVFAIDRFGKLLSAADRRDLIARRQQPDEADRPYSVLSAYELRSGRGRRVWSVGGPVDAESPLAGALFLGAPLPLQGQLYVIAEVAGEVRLVVLTATSGKLLWSQTLAVVPSGRFEPPFRGIGGISPSFAEGILVCPTGVGASAAVDLTTRSLLWAYEYPVAQVSRFARPTLDAAASWADSCAVISGRNVLITPAESQQMHCLDLVDGSAQWSLDRGGLAFLGCVDRRLAVLVGRRRLTAIELSTGKVAAGWPVELPPGSLPSGRGYYAGGHYYLPLYVNGDGEVAAIQLDPPAIVHRSQCPSGTIPGNLICHRGQVLSQNADLLESFNQAQLPAPGEFNSD